MSEYYWFKLLVRLIGLLLIGMGMPMFLYEVGTIAMMVVPGSPTYTSGSTRYSLIAVLPALVAYGAQTAFGVYLFLKGQWVIQKIVSEIHGRCAVCGYDLKDTKAETCPECNAPVRRANMVRSGEGPRPE